MNSLRFFLILAMVALLSSACLSSTYAPTGDLLELIDVTRLPYLKDGVVTQVSSYDRTGANNDGFEGTYSYLYKENGKFVIFDSKGPGCIYRIWSANPDKGRIRFYFDGESEPRVDVPTFEGLFTGQFKPFVDPLAKNFLGGWCSYMPIPFAKSCKIVADGPVKFLQITWQKFPADRQVTTFRPDFSLQDRIKLRQVVNTWSNLGADPWPVTNGKSVSLHKKLAVNKSVTLLDQDGPGQIRALRIKIDPTDRATLRDAVLEVYVDGMKQPTVWSPVGDFFLDGLNQGISKSLLLGKKDGTYYCYFPMPFKRNIRVKITNQSKSALNLDSEIEWEPMKTFPDDMCRFYAWWHEQFPTTKGKSFPMLEATGRGHFCGVSHAMSWAEHHLFFLEGDEMMWIDDRDNSYYNGTGTEDYFNGGWYFQATGSAPLYGCGVFDPKGGRCLAYRLQMTDYVPFQQKARIEMEHSPQNEVNANYAGVTYWYAMPGTTHTFTPVGVDKRIPDDTKRL